MRTIRVWRERLGRWIARLTGETVDAEGPRVCPDCGQHLIKVETK